MRCRSVLIAAGLAVLSSGLLAQTPTDGPRFELASIRLMDPSQRCISTASRFGQPTWTMGPVPLRAFVSLAFDVTRWEGMPSWEPDECYIVAVKAEDGVLLSREELRPRLRQLLVDRLHLVTHMDTTMTNGFGLVIAKGGPKLTAGTKPLGPTALVPGRLRNPSVNMDFLARALSAVLQQPVIDETGLSGTYDVTLTFAPEGSTDSPLPSIFTALQEQLGLKLESGRKVPVQKLVIDHMERPSEN